MRTTPLSGIRRLMIVLLIFAGVTYLLSIPGRSAGHAESFASRFRSGDMISWSGGIRDANAHALFSRSSAQDPSASLEKEDVLVAVTGQNTVRDPNNDDQQPGGKTEQLPETTLSDMTANWMAEAAIARWQSAGATSEELDQMHAAAIEVVGLAGKRLAVTSQTKIQLSADAAGFGWFVDQTPLDDSEFPLPIRNRQLQADQDSPAFGHIDLLTALMHAYAVVSGRQVAAKNGSVAADISERWLLKSSLPTGVRRVPNALPTVNKFTPDIPAPPPITLPPDLSISFSDPTIPLNGSTTLVFTITNPNLGASLSGIAFTTTLPAGLSVANSTSTTCGGGTLTTTAPNTITFSGGSMIGEGVAGGGPCVFSVTVKGIEAGDQVTNPGTITANESGGATGTFNTAELTVVSPPSISKEFDLISQIGASPAGATESGNTVTITTTAPHHFLAGQTVTIAGIGVAGYNGSFTIGSVPTATEFTYADSNAGLAASGGGTATVTVPTMPLNGTVTLVFNLSNPNSDTTLTGVSFTDGLPSGLRVAVTPNASTSCGGTFAPNTGDTTLTFSNGSIDASGTCTIMVDVTAVTAGVKNNTTTAVLSNEGGTGNTANASVAVLTPPSISKMFGASTIALNTATTLSFTITNPNSTAQLTGVGFSDPLPSGLQVASTPGAVSCGSGTFNPSAGDTTVTFSGGTIAAGGSCTVSVNVTATSPGPKNNTTGNVISNEGGSGSTASASLTVGTPPPTITNAFGASSVLVGGTTSLTFTITNAGSQGITGVSFTDTLPAGLSVANGTATTCGGGTVTASASAGTITLTGGAISAGGNCQFSVTVTGATAGVWNNTTGPVSSNESGAGTGSNTATLTVIAFPTISASFDAATIPVGGTSVLTYTISNPNTSTTLTGVGFVGTLPFGLTVPNGTASTCGGGTISTVAPEAIILRGGSIGPSSNCVMSVTVTGVTAGVKDTTTAPVTLAGGAKGPTSNTATITVVGPPTISDAFGASSIAIHAVTTLTFTISNPNTSTSLTGAAFTDVLPPGLQVALVPGASTSCGGNFAPNPGDTTLNYSGGTIAAGGSCTVSVNITAITAGVKNNTTTTISSTNGGTGTPSNTATLTVAAAPTITDSFGAATIPQGGTTSLTFAITNPNPALGITGVAFTDTLPAGLTVPNSTLTTCGGGTVTLTAPGTIALSGGGIAAGGTCQFSITVKGTAAGIMNNVAGAVSSTQTGAGSASNRATVTVVGAPTITKAFSDLTVPLNGTTTVTFTITNSNSSTALTGVNFSDPLPTGLVVAATPAIVNDLGGTVTAQAGASMISITGGGVPSGGSATLSVNVTPTVAGVLNNTTGPVNSTNGGTGVGSNTATITVLAPPTISKAFGEAVVPPGQTTTLTFTVTNPNPTAALTGVGFIDDFPEGLVVANPASASAGCGGTFAPKPGDTSLTFTDGTIAAGASCTVAVTAQLTTPTTKTNITGPITSANGGTGLPSNMAVVSSLDKCLHDDHTEDYIQFSSITGDYVFTHCGTGAFTLQGKGTLTTQSGMLVITDKETSRTVTIGYNTGSLTGTAVVTVSSAPGLSQTYRISDTNPHPVCQCGT